MGPRIPRYSICVSISVPASPKFEDKQKRKKEGRRGKKRNCGKKEKVGKEERGKKSVRTGGKQ